MTSVQENGKAQEFCCELFAAEFTERASVRVFSVCVTFIIVALGAGRPWVLVVWLMHKLYCRLVGPR